MYSSHVPRHQFEHEHRGRYEFLERMRAFFSWFPLSLGRVPRARSNGHLPGRTANVKDFVQFSVL